MAFRDKDVAAAARAFTGGAGVDVAYDSVGKSSQEASLNSLKPRGWWISFGNASGPAEPVAPGRLSQMGSLVMTRPTLFPETLDRTTLAGFTQIYDDQPGLEFRSIAGGVDVKLMENIRAGLSTTSLRIRFPDRGTGPGEADQVEIRGYVAATLGDRVSLGIEPSYMNFDSAVPQQVQQVDTWVVPLTGSYFHPSGAFASGTVSFATQSGVSAQGAPFSDEGVIFDAVIGFRLPNGRGVITLEALNLFDTQLSLIDSTTVLSTGTFQDTLTQQPRFAPRRSIMATAKLRF